MNKRHGDEAHRQPTQEDIIRQIRGAARDKVWTVTTLILAFVERYGEEAWEIARKVGWARGEWKAPRIEKTMKEKGADFNDPRDRRKYGREDIGFLDYVKQNEDRVTVKPDGKVKVEYEITRCPWTDTWKEMGLSNEVQLKLDTCLGYQSDQATNKYFNTRYECDQGMARGLSCCKFILEKL